MNSVAVAERIPASGSRTNPLTIFAAVAAGAGLEALWPQMFRGVVLAAKIAFFVVMSTR